MGKWSQVRCNCDNRIPLPKSNYRDQPHQGRAYKQLSKKQRQEIEIWQKNIENMYECGHRNGMLIQLCPSQIIKLGYILEKVLKYDRHSFETFIRVGDWRNYYSKDLNEELHISPQEAELWLIETVELKQAFLGQGNIPYQQVQQIINILYQRQVKCDRDLKQRFESFAEKEFTRIMPLLENLEDDLVTPDSVMKKQLAVFKDIVRLCEASIQSGNSIELLW